ncbi:MAG: DUF1972 domain-containing protein [Halieaceae bacterium]|uniref:DUF1972 domain-containing protein n=1 Tax=Haliea alexandrii TaxID=2448162 RepID=UPI000F0B63DB|nr:DUF1972 domain-containing protein [Haliea alexandrii]MCR9185094.1 DUF1972 domain-containing protein [Halieaceae bacterium]
MSRADWSILGTVGVPGNYGGFETLAENLVRFHARHDIDATLSVYCSARAFETRPARFQGANLRYISLDANGPQSIAYDILSLIDAVRRRTGVILLLGVSGALVLPFLRAFSRSRIVTNIDGVEWKREKWTGIARLILRWSEWAAVRWSHVVIADNTAIAEYVREIYDTECHVIAYGGDHALGAEPVAVPGLVLPQGYTLSLCRIEPENNITMILEAFVRMPDRPLVFVGNWGKSEYGRGLRARFGASPHLCLLDPIYDPGHLRWIRDGARAYVHGHSAGGTNPSLVEMMHFGIPVVAHGCRFNRCTTEDRAAYFSSAQALVEEVEGLDPARASEIGCAMIEIARRRYTWEQVGRAYFDLIERV